MSVDASKDAKRVSDTDPAADVRLSYLQFIQKSRPRSLEYLQYS